MKAGLGDHSKLALLFGCLLGSQLVLCAHAASDSRSDSKEASASLGPIVEVQPVPTNAVASDQKLTVVKKTKAPAAPEIMQEYRAPLLEKDRPGFFARNAAQTTFSAKTAMGSKPKLEYFPAVSPVEEEITVEAAKVALQPQATQPSNSPGAPVAENLKSAAGIIAAYGDPKEDDTILAIDSAPPSFKGMMAALQMGNEQLAWQYARRYARRTRELASRSATVMGLTGKAFEREGVLPKNSWQSAPQFDAQQKLLDEDLKASGLIDSEKSRVSKLDPNTKAFLARAQEAEEMQANPKKPQAQPVALDENQLRAKIRAARAGKVPVDPQGLLDIYFFFRPGDEKARLMAPEIEQLYKKISLQGGVSFIALTMDAANPLAIEEFKLATKASFPIHSGATMTKEFQLKESPTTLLITQTTSKVVTEEGVRKFIYLDELTNIMRGK